MSLRHRIGIVVTLVLVVMTGVPTAPVYPQTIPPWEWETPTPIPTATPSPRPISRPPFNPPGFPDWAKARVITYSDCQPNGSGATCSTRESDSSRTLYHHPASMRTRTLCATTRPDAGCEAPPTGDAPVAIPRPRCINAYGQMLGYPSGVWYYGGHFDIVEVYTGSGWQAVTQRGPYQVHWAFAANDTCSLLDPTATPVIVPTMTPTVTPTYPPGVTPPPTSPPPPATHTPTATPTEQSRPCFDYRDARDLLFQAGAQLSLTVNGIPVTNWNSRRTAQPNPDIGTALAQLIEETPIQSSLTGTAALTIAPGGILIRSGATGQVAMSTVNNVPTTVDMHRGFALVIKDLGPDQQLGTDDTVLAWLELSGGIDRINQEPIALHEPRYWAMGVGQFLFRPAQLLQGRRPIRRDPRIADGPVQLNMDRGVTVSGGQIFSAYRAIRNRDSNGNPIWNSFTFVYDPPYSYYNGRWLLDNQPERRFRPWPEISETNFWGNFDLLAGPDPLTITWPVQSDRAYVVALFASEGQCGVQGFTAYHLIAQRFGASPADAAVSITAPQTAARGSVVTQHVTVYAPLPPQGMEPARVRNVALRLRYATAPAPLPTITVRGDLNGRPPIQPAMDQWIALGDMQPGQTIQFRVDTLVTDSMPSPLHLIAEIRAENDANSTNNRAEGITQLDPYRDAAVTIRIPQMVYEGEVFTATITVRNLTGTGVNADPTPFPSILLRYQVDNAEILAVSHGSRERTSSTWTIDRLAPGESRTMTVTLRMPRQPRSPQGVPTRFNPLILHTAQITADGDGNPTNNRAVATTYARPALTLDDSITVTTLAAGDLDQNEQVFRLDTSATIQWPAGQTLRLAPQIEITSPVTIEPPVYRFTMEPIAWRIDAIEVQDASGAYQSIAWTCPPASARALPTRMPDQGGCWFRVATHPTYHQMTGMANLFWSVAATNQPRTDSLIVLPYNPPQSPPNQRAVRIVVSYAVVTTMQESGVVDMNQDGSTTSIVIQETDYRTAIIPLRIGAVQSGP